MSDWKFFWKQTCFRDTLCHLQELSHNLSVLLWGMLYRDSRYYGTAFILLWKYFGNNTIITMSWLWSSDLNIFCSPHRYWTLRKLPQWSPCKCKQIPTIVFQMRLLRFVVSMCIETPFAAFIYILYMLQGKITKFPFSTIRKVSLNV